MLRARQDSENEGGNARAKGKSIPGHRQALGVIGNSNSIANRVRGKPHQLGRAASLAVPQFQVHVDEPAPQRKTHSQDNKLADAAKSSQSWNNTASSSSAITATSSVSSTLCDKSDAVPRGSAAKRAALVDALAKVPQAQGRPLQPVKRHRIILRDENWVDSDEEQEKDKYDRSDAHFDPAPNPLRHRMCILEHSQNDSDCDMEEESSSATRAPPVASRCNSGITPNVEGLVCTSGAKENLKPDGTQRKRIRLEAESSASSSQSVLSSLPDMAASSPGASTLCMSMEEDTELDTLDTSEFYSAPAPSARQRHDMAIFEYPTYAGDVMAYMRYRETLPHLRPSVNFMRKQKDLSAEYRTIMVDWFVDVADEYDIGQEALHLGVAYADRFMSHMAVPKVNLQLVGVAALMVASKYEEVYPPEVNDFVYVTDDSYTMEQVLRMEMHLLHALQYDVSSPTAAWFAERHKSACRLDNRAKHLVDYLLELALLDYDMIKYLPSQIGVAAVSMAMLSLGANPWPSELLESADYGVADFHECMQRLHRLHKTAAEMEHKAVLNRYKSAGLSAVAFLPAAKCVPPVPSHDRSVLSRAAHGHL